MSLIQLICWLGDYLHGRKFPQTHWLVERMKLLHSDFLHVLDIGGGRGDLAVTIARRFPDVVVTVIDKNELSLNQAEQFVATSERDISERINFVNSSFSIEFDALSPESLRKVEDKHCNFRKPVDLVVALHACGGLSDAALEYAAVNQCKFLICPCCYLKNPFTTVIKAPAHKVEDQKARYDKFVRECVAPADSTVCSSSSPECSSPEWLCRLAESDEREISVKASVIINSRRLHRVAPHYTSAVASCDDGSIDAVKLSMEQFSEDFSQRNIVLVCDK
jgi:hypothetical protein